jgi:hypothetical protein
VASIGERFVADDQSNTKYRTTRAAMLGVAFRTCSRTPINTANALDRTAVHMPAIPPFRNYLSIVAIARKRCARK